MVPLLAAAIVAACAPAPVTPEPLPATDVSAWADCLTGLEGGGRAQECAAWRVGRTEGRIAGVAAAEQDARIATRDGYRVRRTVALLLSVATALLAGAAAGSALRRRLGRRNSRPYSELTLSRIRAEAEAIEALGRTDPLVAQVVERVSEPLGSLVAAADAVGRRAQALTARPDSETAQAHLDGLCDALDGCLARVERLHVQVTVWHEQAAASGGAEGAIDGAIARALLDLRGAIEEIDV